MSDKKISQLDAVTTVDDTDEYVVARSGTSKKITGASLKSELAGGGSLPAGITSPGDGALAFAPTDPNQTVERIDMPADSTANGTAAYKLVDEFGTTIAEFDADGTFLFKMQQDFSGITFLDGSNAGTGAIVQIEAGMRLGFFGHAAATQPAAPTTLGDVIAALKALGLVAT